MEMVWEVIEELRELNVVTMIIRIFLAALAGGIVGLERGFHGRAAGLRTHMLVCLGAALTALIGCYLSIELGGSDPQRTGAQVMSGVGFLGAGTILLKKGNGSDYGGRSLGNGGNRTFNRIRALRGGDCYGFCGCHCLYADVARGVSHEPQASKSLFLSGA